MIISGIFFSVLYKRNEDGIHIFFNIVGLYKIDARLNIHNEVDDDEFIERKITNDQ